MINTYKPPAASLPLLGNIVTLLLTATKIDCPGFVRGGQNVFKIAPDSGMEHGYVVYFEGLLDLDADGSVYAEADPSGQSDTSLHNADGSPLDSNAIPFYVLPGGWYEGHSIQPGDYAAVIYGNRIEFAIFGDVGPHNQMGEGSIALHRALGHETIINGHFRDEAIDSGVIFVVFPGSGDGSPQTPDIIRAKGRASFTKLTGVMTEYLAGSPGGRNFPLSGASTDLVQSSGNGVSGRS